MTEEHLERLGQLLSKFDNMWDGNLGEINTSSHQIDLEPGAQPVTQRPYCTWTKAREFIEPSISKWASAVFIVSKHKLSYSNFIGYRKLNIVTIRDTYPLSRMDECTDSLKDSIIFSTLDANWAY